MTNVLIHSFNNGEASRAALARVDQERLRLFAEVQENLFPYKIGKMIMRPGTRYLGDAANAEATLVPFKRSLATRALLEMSYTGDITGEMRVWSSDVLVTRPAVTSAITTGDFASATGWTSVLEAGATAGFSSALTLNCPNLEGKATVRQQVSTSSAGTEHALRIVVARGPVRFKCGSSSGDDDYISETTLDRGEFSLAFTPSGSYWVEFYSEEPYPIQVNSIEVEGAGAMAVPGIWGGDSLRELQYDQSLDVIFLATPDQPPQKIEKRAGNSWGVARYETTNGPFTTGRTRNVKLTPSVTRGFGTLTASAPFFEAGHQDTLFKLTHENTNATFTFAKADTVSDAIRVIGITADREFSVTTSGTWAGTLQIQRSFDGEFSGFEDYGAAITTNTTTNVDDGDDNAIVFYRVKMTAYTSGTATVVINYAGDGGSGICRIGLVTSSTTATMSVLDNFTDVAATDDWQEGEWSRKRGYPTGVAFFDGRLWWSADDRFWGSVSDDYYNFSRDIEGDSASIQRNIAAGGDFAEINWLLPLQRLLFGTTGAEISARSSSFDEPLTPGNITLKPASTQGSARVVPIKLDSRGLFAHRSRRKVYQMAYDIEASDYVSTDAMKFNEDLTLDRYSGTLTGRIVDAAASRQPETYVWWVREDGAILVQFFEPGENINCWVRFLSGHLAYEGVNPIGYDRIISVAVLPDVDEDEVYFVVERAASDGEEFQGAYHIEKLAKHSETIIRTYDEDNGDFTVTNGIRMCDSHITFTGDSTLGQVVSGLGHIEGRDVIVIGQVVGGAFGPTGTIYTVEDGSITLTERMSGTCATGLPYFGRWKSSKLAYGTRDGTALIQRKHVNQVGLVLHDTNLDGILIGRNLVEAEMDALPMRGNDLRIRSSLDPLEGTREEGLHNFPGSWDTDSRAALMVKPGHCATISAFVMSVETKEK